MNEGSSRLKMAATTNQLPTGASLVPLNIDAYSLPSDWYLQVAGQAGKMLRGEISVTNTLPTGPF